MEFLMRKVLFSAIFFIIFFTSHLFIYANGSFTLKSKDLGGQGTLEQVFNGFGCTGENISPELNWQNIPEGTKSFAITMYDPDAPTGSGWWHWIMFDIPANTTELKKGAGNVEKNLAPKNSIQSVTDFGSFGYGGPCPPNGHGFHRYIITIHALKVDKLNLDKNANPAVVGYNLNFNTIEKSSIMFYYKRD
jgi:Raf kinase inhibitor-like YbhB/YbcL family protein